MLDTSRISTRGKIWELHIHSNQCFSADENLKRLSVDEYVTQLLDILEPYADLDMISFTDHNHISSELYRSFIEQNSKITLLPGVEVDTALQKDGIAKHIIVYFDAVDDADKIDLIAERLNAFFQDKKVGSQKGQAPIYIYEPLDMLASLNVEFILSPHAMKQGKRSIDDEWHAMEESLRKGEVKKYIDQFFCFWESSGSSQIHHASDFLRGMDSGERISIVAFSDSKDFDKLRRCLDNPCQFFNALPNFNGLKMAGSELSRITRKQFYVEERDLGYYIGRITFDGQEMLLSPKLNAVIGGRGSGKSVLLDSVAANLSSDSLPIPKQRNEFVSSFSVSTSNMNGNPIEPGQFHFDYYNQNYISKLFEKNGEDFNREVGRYFSDEFTKITPPDAGAIRRANEEQFESLFAGPNSSVSTNLSGFIEKYVVDNQDTLSIAIRAKDKRKVDPKLSAFDYSTTVNTLRKTIEQKLPIFILEDEAVTKSIADLCESVCRAGYENRLKYLNSDYLYNLIYSNFKDTKDQISKAQKERSETIESFKALFEEKAEPYRKRVALINAYLEAAVDFVCHYEEKSFANGERKNAFLFKRELEVEHPIKHMIKLFNEQMTALRGTGADTGMCTLDNLDNFIQRFCYGSGCYKQNCSSETLCAALTEYALSYESKLSIHYLQDDGSYIDITEQSPGTQTNILLEYIVHRDTNNPLLIDQPEDNVDNQTIYSKIKNWFFTLKQARQVIVVTHDANIVINADADNVILANQESPGCFRYQWGALESEDMLERASLILDGGKEAVKRRLIKYGE